MVVESILGDPGADSGDEGKSKGAEKCGTKKSKERREELVRHCPQGLFSPFFTFLRSIYIFPPVETFPRPLYLPLSLRGWVESRSVKRNAKNARGLGRDRAVVRAYFRFYLGLVSI